MVTSWDRGHVIVFRQDKWFYQDNGLEAMGERACKRCGRRPTPEGYDACTGYIEGAVSVCCGHGVERSVLIMNEMRNDVK